MMSEVRGTRRFMVGYVAVLVCALAWLGTGTASAMQDEDAAAAAASQATQEPTPASPDSPRVSLTNYLELCRDNDYTAAAAYLDLDGAKVKDPAVVARRLKAVLDQHVWFDLEAISPDAQGDREDDLADDLEVIGHVPGPSGGDEPVFLVRRETKQGARWVFTAGTVARVDAWYEALEHRWALELLPPTLLAPGPGELLWWQWLALPVLLIASWILGFILSRITHGIMQRIAARTQGDFDDVVLERLDGPLTLGWSIAVLYMLVPFLAMYQPAEDLIHRILKVGLYFVFFWSLLRIVDVLGQYLLGSEWAESHPASRSLVPLGGRLIKILLIVMATIGMLSTLGFPVASLVAGLGVGGLAFALAAKSTVENLFGAFAMGVDQPIRVGDYVKVDDFTGTVESIGMRSTRIRTLDRTTVSMPNGKIADMKLETFATRDRMRLKTAIGVEYGTTAAQMREILEGCETVLRDIPETWPDNVVVRFAEYGDSSLNIEIICYFQVPDYNAFRACRQTALLGFMEVVEKAGSGFAFPTRTVHLVSEAPNPPGTLPPT
jgi:MscS family membrane protein